MTQVLLVNPENDIMTLAREPVTRINSNDIVYFTDTYCAARVDQIVSAYGKPAAVITDIESTVLPTEIPVFFIPNLYRGFVHWTDIVNSGRLPEFGTATKCFNFSMNKCDPVRTLILKLIEWFQFDNYQYTWSGLGAVEDMSGVISEFSDISAAWLTDQFRTHILSPVNQIQPRWIDIGRTLAQQPSFRRDQGLELTQWQTFLPSLIGNTAVSLITDPPSEFGRNFVFAERWVYTVASLTFNIWPGTFGQAQQAQRMGFDIFEDVIDHSYQYHNTVLERCYYALVNNQQLLTDLDYANACRSTQKTRLLSNRELMLGNSVKTWIDQQVNQMTPPHRLLVRDIMNSGLRY